MAIQTIYDTGSSYQITSKYDGAVYDVATGGDCVCKGIGDQFTPIYSASSLNVSFGAGSEAIICGSFFKVLSATSITLPANSTIYLCARIDTSQQAGATGSFQALTQAQITSGNLNGTGTTRDLPLYKIVTSNNGVSSIEDKRVIRGASDTTIGNYTLWVGTQAQYDAITTKDNGTLYFIKED